jgi:hypothetical protein
MNFQSIADQIAAHVQVEMLRGRWTTAILERRIEFLHLERHEEQRDAHLFQLWHALEEAGHHVLSAQQTLTDVRFEVKRVAAVVGRTMADAGIVCTGSRRGVLEWFARQPLPTFALFRLTPPTALIVDETAWIIAAMNHLLRLGLRVPDDVSLVSTDDHPTLQCCHPPVARIAWDSGSVIRRILKWAHNISHGRPDVRQSLTPSRFIPGGTIGPAPVPRAKA